VSATIAARATSGGYRAVVLGFSAQGRDVGPRVAAKLDAPIVTDVTEIAASGDVITVKHPGYANKVVATLEVKGSPCVLAVRPSAFTPVASAKAGRVEAMAPASDPSASR